MEAIKTAQDRVSNLILGSNATTEEKTAILLALKEYSNTRTKVYERLTEMMEELGLNIRIMDFDRNCLRQELNQLRDQQ